MHGWTLKASRSIAGGESFAREGVVCGFAGLPHCEISLSPVVEAVSVCRNSRLLWKLHPVMETTSRCGSHIPLRKLHRIMEVTSLWETHNDIMSNEVNGIVIDMYIFYVYGMVNKG